MLQHARALLPLLCLIVMACSPAAQAVATKQEDCASHYLDGQQPIISEKMKPRTQQICFTSFAVLHSGLSRTPIWSAEFISRDTVAAARRLERTSEFFVEPRLSPDERADLSDYKRSGFDRGHLAPSADMPTQDAQQESFSLANIIPQNGQLNRHVWADIESDVRDAATRYGLAYVVTGPLFEGAQTDTLRGRVMVPTHVWKAVHIPTQGSVVLVATNEAQTKIENLSPEEFASKHGIVPFPSLPAPARRQMLQIN